MVEEKDVETLIKAKSDQIAINILQGLSVSSLAILIFLEAFMAKQDYTIILATFATVFMCGAAGQSRWVSVSRDQPIQTLERITNSDAGALKILAAKRKTNISSGNRK